MVSLILAACLIAQPSIPVVYISGPPGRTSIASTNHGDHA